MVRFVNGEPQDIYLSAHSGGSAYTYNTLTTSSSGGRAITYIANGTHANYATPGAHQHDLPGLDDQTDAGQLWDVAKNFRGLSYHCIRLCESTTSFNSGGSSGIRYVDQHLVAHLEDNTVYCKASMWSYSWPQ